MKVKVLVTQSDVPDSGVDQRILGTDPPGVAVRGVVKREVNR